MLNNQEFKIELLELLNKYNVSISWGCTDSSDLHGVYGEYMEIYTREGETLLKLKGNTINAYEIEDQGE